jgi:hypothetical protein
MERTTFLKNYRIRLQYDGTPYEPDRNGPAISYEAVDERTGEPVSVTLISAESVDPVGKGSLRTMYRPLRSCTTSTSRKFSILDAKATITFMCRSGLRVRHLRHGCATME